MPRCRPLPPQPLIPNDSATLTITRTRPPIKVVTAPVDGPTSSPVELSTSHTAALVERHEIRVPSSGLPLTDPQVATLLKVCTRAAMQWTQDTGMEIVDSVCFHEDNAVGVRFHITIGAGAGGEESARRSDGHAQGWFWSARMAHWIDVFRVLQRRPRVAVLTSSDGDGTDENELCPIIPLFSEECPVVGSEYGID